MTYPSVLTESATLAAVVAGHSLARYGDGEFNLCRGHGIPSQPYAAALQARLREILHHSGDCLVGIPNIRSATPKAAFWSRYGAVSDLLTERAYVSAFISRPDSAPWIDTADYWTQLEALWRDQHVTLVRGGSRSLTAEDLASARGITEIIAPREGAWQDYEELLESIGRPSRALLCLGPTATVLAVDLCARGVHAIDLGHAGMWYRKYRRGEPMVKTDEDSAL